MTIKKLAHTAQRAIQATSGSAFKLGHIYELLAAALGFASYASLCTDHVFDVNPGRRSDVANRLLDRIHPRAISLGHAPEVALLAATTLAHAVEEERICVRHIDDVLRSAQQGYGFVDDFSGDDDDDLQEAEGAWADADPGHPSSGAYSTVLRESLQRGAAAGDHRAHYALALLPGVDQDEFDDIEAEGSAHWYRLRQEGTELHGVEKEWADAYAATLERAQALQRVDEAALMHLEQAAELGNTDALMDLAEQRGDRMYFHRAAAAGGNPSRLADLAGRFDQPNIQHWLTRAAEHGDAWAMRTLIEQFDHRDLRACWKWIYYAELCGADLRKGSMRAYHDGGLYDGQEYDDDQGGPLYVAGDEGVQLESLAPSDDAMAREDAAALFKHRQYS